MSNTLQFRPWSRFQTTASVSHDPYTRVPLSSQGDDRCHADRGDSGRHPGHHRHRRSNVRRIWKRGPSGVRQQHEAVGNAPASTGASWSTQINHSYSTSRGVPKPVRSLTLNSPSRFIRHRSGGATAASTRTPSPAKVISLDQPVPRPALLGAELRAPRPAAMPSTCSILPFGSFPT